MLFRSDDLSRKHIEQLRSLTKNIQDARLARNQEDIRRWLKQYDEALERYIPVLMSQARIYWDLEHYPMVEKIFRQSAEFCSEHEVWVLNVAHVFFLQETKFKEAIRYYEPTVKKHAAAILNVPAIVLANLCVAYIMTSQNEEAEDLMRRVEREEERGDPNKQAFHLCIINLVIGTLYCAKGNFEFGISRIIKSLEPYDKKIGMYVMKGDDVAPHTYRRKVLFDSEEIEGDEVVDSTPFMAYRDVTCNTMDEEDHKPLAPYERYVMIPSTFEPGKYGKFRIEIGRASCRERV